MTIDNRIAPLLARVRERYTDPAPGVEDPDALLVDLVDLVDQLRRERLTIVELLGTIEELAGSLRRELEP